MYHPIESPVPDKNKKKMNMNKNENNKNKNNRKPVSCMYLTFFPESGVCTTVSRFPLSVTR